MLYSDWQQLAPVRSNPYFRLRARVGTLLALDIELLLGPSHPWTLGGVGFSFADLLTEASIQVNLTYVRRVQGIHIADPGPTFSNGWQVHRWRMGDLYISMQNSAWEFDFNLAFPTVVSTGEAILIVTEWWCDETDMPTMEMYNRSIMQGRRASQNVAPAPPPPGVGSPFSTVGIAATSPPITYQPPANSPVTKPRRRAPGPVVGFKLLTFTDGVLRSPIQHTRWDAREMSEQFFAGREGQVVDSKTGIYSYYSLPDLAASGTWDSIKVRTRDDLVVVAVLCTGALALHENGMRAQRARVLAILRPPHSVVKRPVEGGASKYRAIDQPSRDHHRLIRQVAKRYRVPVLRRHNFDRYTSEWLVGKERILAAMEDVT